MITPAEIQALHDEDSLTLREKAAHIAGVLASRHGNDEVARVFENIGGALRAQETAARLKVAS